MTKLPKIKSMKEMVVTFEADGAELSAEDFFDLVGIKVDGRSLSSSEVTNGAKAMEYRHSKAKQDKIIRELINNGKLKFEVNNEEKDLEEV